MIRKKYYTMRLKSLVIILFLLFFSMVLLPLMKEDNLSSRVHHHRQQALGDRAEGQALNGHNLVDHSFVTHLPLVIIDTYGEKIQAESVWDREKGYRVPVDFDPYAKGYISIIDNENGRNTLQDEPSVSSDILIRLRGNSSLGFDKKQYLVKLINEDGSKNKQNLLGMGEDWEWIINISFVDKSLLRNYMCLNLAGEVMPYTPEVRFCEVILREGTQNIYQGVYLIEESVKQGPDRVGIAEYDPRYPHSGYILRRDRYDEAGIMLNPYGTEQRLTPDYLDIKYPPKSKIVDETIKYIEDDVSAFEKAIFSDNHYDFLTYANYIDEQSFIDYFIINEFFANYDAGYYSTYMYKDYGGKIFMGPVWDFDHALDNFHLKKMNYLSTAMHDAPWFRQLLKHEEFVTKLIKRYHELRQTVLSEKNILNYIDGTVEFLGPAKQRDWQRWGYFYTSNYLSDTDEKDNPINRNTKTYDEEISKIKNVIINHGRWLDENIDSLYQFSEYRGNIGGKGLFYHFSETILGKEREAWLGGVAAILFIAVFMISIILVQRE